MKRWNRNFNLNAGIIQPKIAVVISAYNKPKELQICLEGYRRQSFSIDHHQEFQLILADDGSKPEIEELFSDFSDSVSFPTTYLRQEHQGWGKLRMMNWSVLECQADQIVFTDGDCVPHKHFVKSHFENFDEKTVSCGRRVDVMSKLSPTLSAAEVRNGTFESYNWLLKNIFQGQLEYGGQAFFLPQWLSRIPRTFSTNKKPTLLGSNFSLHKKWLIDLNGFEESFQTPGIGEDTDLERRLTMAGAKLKWITYQAIQFHLWHPLTTVGEPTHKTFENLKSKGNKTALKGLKEVQPLLKNSFPS